jgi:hypothetical protein
MIPSLGHASGQTKMQYAPSMGNNTISEVYKQLDELAVRTEYG